MRFRSVLILLNAALICGGAVARAESPHLQGSWKVEIAFANGEKRTVAFEAQEAGKGSFRLLDPQARVGITATPSPASWSQGEGSSVTFSGAIEFPLGNVGRETGQLLCNGQMEKDGSLAGEVTFTPRSGEQPSKRGTFKATRAAGG